MNRLDVQGLHGMKNHERRRTTAISGYVFHIDGNIDQTNHVSSPDYP
jgi:hypothetical protein